MPSFSAILSRGLRFARADDKGRRIRDLHDYLMAEARIRAGMLRLVRHRGADSIELRNGLVIADVDDEVDRTFKAVWIRRDYSPPGFEIGPEDVIVDIGAHVGVFAIYAAHRARAGRVLSFEPLPTSFERLRRNLASNRLENVTARNVAIAAAAGSRTFHSREGMSMGSSLFAENLGHGPGAASTCTVPCISLEDAFREHNVEVCDLLKLDCELAEHEILGAAPAHLWPRIRRIAMEYHTAGPQRSAESLTRLLTERGFRVRYVPFSRKGTTGLLYAWRQAATGS